MAGGYKTSAAATQEIDEREAGPRPRTPKAAPGEGLSEGAMKRQAARLQVKISTNYYTMLKERMAEIEQTIGRRGRGMGYLQRVGLRLPLIDVMRHVEREEYEKYDVGRNITLEPWDALLQRAREYHISPHLIVRAAAVSVILDGWPPDIIEEAAALRG